MYKEQQDREKELEDKKQKLISNLNDDEFDDVLAELIQERQERKRRKESDMEM